MRAQISSGLRVVAVRAREANGDVVQLATYGDLMANSRDDHGSAGTSTILIDAARSFGSPSWVRTAAVRPAEIGLLLL